MERLPIDSMHSLLNTSHKDAYAWHAIGQAGKWAKSVVGYTVKVCSKSFAVEYGKSSPEWGRLRQPVEA